MSSDLGDRNQLSDFASRGRGFESHRLHHPPRPWPLRREVREAGRCTGRVTSGVRRWLMRRPARDPADAGVDWSTVTGFSDVDTLDAMRRIQRVLSRSQLPLIGTAPTNTP